MAYESSSNLVLIPLYLLKRMWEFSQVPSCQTIETLFSRETDERRKKEEHLRKKVCSCCEVFFCNRAYSSDLIGHILSASEPRKSHAD